MKWRKDDERSERSRCCPCRCIECIVLCCLLSTENSPCEFTPSAAHFRVGSRSTEEEQRRQKEMVKCAREMLTEQSKSFIPVRGAEGGGERQKRKRGGVGALFPARLLDTACCHPYPPPPPRLSPSCPLLSPPNRLLSLPFPQETHSLKSAVVSEFLRLCVYPRCFFSAAGLLAHSETAAVLCLHALFSFVFQLPACLCRFHTT